MQESVTALNQAMQKAHHWLIELKEIGDFQSEEQAYSVLRAVLHAFRDTLPMNEVVHLASEMPMIIRGIYFEGWNPSRLIKVKSTEDFLNLVANSLRNASFNVDTQKATVAVFTLLKKNISKGELADVSAVLSKEISPLWEEPTSI